MSDAVSTIALGIDTGTGLEQLKAMRLEFKGLREEISALNSLRADAKGLTGGVGAASNELATLSAELKASGARVNELEQQLARLGKTQADNAKATTQVVKSEAKQQFDIQVLTANNIAKDIAAAEEKTTAKIKEEAAKRYAIGQSAKVNGVSYSMKAGGSEGEFNKALIEAEFTRREILANSQAMIIADVDRWEALRREKLANSQAMQMADIDRADALRREKNATAQSMLIAEVERGEIRRREVLAMSQQMIMADIDRADALRREKAAVSQAMMIADIERADAIKREKNAVAQQMLIADINRKEAQQIEVARNARTMQMAEIDRADAQKREKNATAQQMLIADIERAEARQNEVIRNARTMQMAEIDRADELRRQKNKTAQEMLIADVERSETKRREVLANSQAMIMANADRADDLRRQKNQTAQEMLIADTERNEARRQAILNNNFNTGSLKSQYNTAVKAQGLSKSAGEGLATQVYGSDAVAAIGRIAAMQEALNAGLKSGTAAQQGLNQAKREALERNKAYVESLREAHSAARGLAGGLGQLWLTYGSVVPLVAGAAITGSMAKVYQIGKDVEYQLQFLRALASDLEREPINIDNFLKITDGTMASVKEAAEGMRALSQAGMNQAQALRALPDILDLAAIGELSVGQAALTATGVVHAFGLELDEISRVGDVFAKIAASSNTSVTAMTESMKQASTVGQMFGLTIEQASATMGVLAQRNITGTSAGTALTTALKNLYEPTAKAKAALDALNISTDNGHGGLKDYTVLMDELRQKVSALNASDQAKFLGTISDQRGAKAMSAVINSFKDYKDFLDDATESTGFMSRATLELEDTVQGASHRMKNTLEGTFIKSFQNAEPAIRTTLRSMTELAGDDSLTSMITRVTVATARFTQVVVENAKWIGIAAATYATLRVVSSVSNAFVIWRTNVAMATLTAQANTAAVAGNAAALTIQEKASLAAGRAAIGLAGATRAASAAFGPISLILMGVVTAYQLLTAETDKADLAQEKQLNRADTVLDYYDRQIEKLRELNKELREKAEHDKNGGADVQGQARGDLVSSAAAAERKYNDLQASYETQKASVGKNPSGFQAVRLEWLANDVKKAKEAFEAAKQKVEKLEQAPEDLIDLKQENKQYRDRENVQNRIERLIDAAGGGLYKGGTEKSQALVPEIRKLLDRVNANGTNYIEVAKEIQGWEDKVNAAKDKFVVPKQDTDAYRAHMASLDGKLQAIKDGERSKLSDIKAALDTNEIGNLQAIAQQLAVVKAARQEELKVLKEKQNYAQGNDKLAAAQQVGNKVEANRRADVEADREADRDRRRLFSQWDQDSLKTQAENLRKRGQLILAFEKEFDSKNGEEMTRNQSDLASGKLDPTQYGKVKTRQNYLESQKKAGTDLAAFDELEGVYDNLLSNMENQLAQVAEKASQTNGFLSDVGAAKAGDEIRERMVPAINEVLDRMRDIANGLNDDGLKASVSKMSTGLIKEADRSRNAWIAASKSISNSLGEAFGKGGKAAGGVVEALVKQRAAQKDIDADLEKNKKANPLNIIELENKARSESAQLQISTYGQIAGAAKGFFDEQSKGYQALKTAEQVFRAFELAESIRVHVVKSGLLASFTGLFATAKTTEVGLQAATVAPTIATESAKQTAYGITGLAAALSLPFPANLPAFAIVSAMLASIGVAVSGSKGGASSGMSLSAGRQKYQGTGHSYDSTNAENNSFEWELQKSESMTKAMDALRDNSTIELRYSSSQLVALESINAGIGGLANMVSVTSGIRGTRADEKALGVYATHSKLGFSSSSTSLLDSGLSFGGSIGSILNGGSVAQSYAELETKKKSFWGLSSSKNQSTQYQNLDASFSEQMSLIVQGMYKSVKDAAVSFGQDGSLVEQALKAMNLSDAGLSRISLKGLSTDEVEKELQGVFGQLGDTMAKTVMPGLTEFQKAGEGYMSTMIRVSSGIESAEYTLQKLGIEALKYTDVLNKQGDITTEIVRASVMHKEATGGVLSGIGQMVESFVGSASELSESYTQLNRVRRTMLATGAKDGNVTSDMVKGAGGLDNLASGMESFLENFFTEGERAAVKANMLNDEFAKLNVAMPKSKDEFKQLVEGLDRATPAGQALYGALLNLSEGFSELSGMTGAVDPALAKQRASIDGLIETAERWMDAAREGRSLLSDIDAELAKNGGKIDNSKRIAELREMMNGTVSFEQQLALAGEIKDLVLEKYEIEKENAEKLIEFGQELSDYVRDLRVSDKSPLTNRQRVAEAEALFQKTLKDLGSSDSKVRESAQDNIQSRADNLLDLAKDYYASSENYTNIFDVVSQQLEAAGVEAMSSGNKAEGLAKSQLQELKDLRAAVVKVTSSIEKEYEISTQQLGTQLRVLDEMSVRLGVISEVPAILRSLPAELAAIVGVKGGLTVPGVNGTAEDGLRNLYREVLKREADEPGLKYWLDTMKAYGTTLDQIRVLMKADTEYQTKVNGSHANGLDYVPFDGYVAELHRGERVLTATEARRTDKAAMASTASFSQTEKAEMAAEIKELRGTLEKVTVNMIEAMHRSTSNAADKTVAGMKDAMPAQQEQPKAKII